MACRVRWGILFSLRACILWGDARDVDGGVFEATGVNYPYMYGLGGLGIGMRAEIANRKQYGHMLRTYTAESIFRFRREPFRKIVQSKICLSPALFGSIEQYV